MKNIALIIAGGVGARMGQDIPKQFINVHDKPVIIYTLEAFQKHPQIDAIEVVCLDGCSDETRIKIYCYIAACGLLWSNWCEYKRNLGVEFGEYSLRQFRYAKDYYRIVKEELKKQGEEE